MSAALPVAWLDLETTGLPPLANVDIVEIAIVHVDAATQKVRPPYSEVVKPPRGIPKSVYAFMPLRDKDVEHAPAFKDVAPTVYKLLHDHVWAGHNIRRYDIPLLEMEFRRAGLQPPKNAGIIDTLDISVQNFSGRSGLYNNKLEVLAQYFGAMHPDEKQTHRALDDVMLNIKVAQYMFAQMYMERTLLPSLQAQPGAPAKPAEPPAAEGEVKAVEVLQVVARCQAITQSGTHCRNRTCQAGKDVNLCGIHWRMSQRGYQLKVVAKAA